MRKSVSKVSYDTLTWIANFLPVGGAYLTCWLVLLFSYVPSGSMLPTLQLEDVLISCQCVSPENVEREDIITFYPATDANTEMGLNPQTTYVKRVIGLPGDTIEISDGILYVNGEAQLRSYTADETTGDFTRVTVPENSFFVMGDNRNYSTDSRLIGFIPYENLRGKVVFHTKNPILSLLRNFTSK